MKKLIKQMAFIKAFLTAYFLLSGVFAVMTISIFDLRKSGFTLGVMEYGFPFTYYTTHCFGANYSWSGLAGNILVAGIFSFGIGLAVSYFRLKFSSPKLRGKWHI